MAFVEVVLTPVCYLDADVKLLKKRWSRHNRQREMSTIERTVDARPHLVESNDDAELRRERELLKQSIRDTRRDGREGSAGASFPEREGDTKGKRAKERGKAEKRAGISTLC